MKRVCLSLCLCLRVRASVSVSVSVCFVNLVCAQAAEREEIATLVSTVESFNRLLQPTAFLEKVGEGWVVLGESAWCARLLLSVLFLSVSASVSVSGWICVLFKFLLRLCVCVCACVCVCVCPSNVCVCVCVCPSNVCVCPSNVVRLMWSV